MATGFFIVDRGEVVQLDYIHVVDRHVIESYLWDTKPLTVIQFEASFAGLPFTYWVDKDASEKETVDSMIGAYRQAVEDKEEDDAEELRHPFYDKDTK